MPNNQYDEAKQEANRRQKAYEKKLAQEIKDENQRQPNGAEGRVEEPTPVDVFDEHRGAQRQSVSTQSQSERAVANESHASPDRQTEYDNLLKAVYGDKWMEAKEERGNAAVGVSYDSSTLEHCDALGNPVEVNGIGVEDARNQGGFTTSWEDYDPEEDRKDPRWEDD